MHVQLSQRIMFQHLKQFQNHIFPPWHRTNTVSFLFFSCGPVYPRQGLLGYPLLGLYSLGVGLITQISWSPSRSPHGIRVALSFFFFFTVIILALLSNTYLKFSL
uniref:Uncharacterized protein n=1 Tax=Opuntia streptacantha TaxID=393608 RepID=A0A7C8YVK8_OPUST